MATIEIAIEDEKIQDLLQSDQGMAALLQPALNQLLAAEMTQHLWAELGERTAERRGWRNGSYERKLTTRVGTLELEVPRDRKGTFQTELFERYQCSEKALVLALMQMVVQDVSTRRASRPARSGPCSEGASTFPAAVAGWGCGSAGRTGIKRRRSGKPRSSLREVCNECLRRPVRHGWPRRRGRSLPLR